MVAEVSLRSFATGWTLRLVRLLLTRADETFDGLGGFIALPLLEFTDPIGDVVYHIASGFAGRF